MWLVVDNGGGYIKYGFRKGLKRCLPNCTGRPRRSATLEFVGEALEPKLGQESWTRLSDAFEGKRDARRGPDSAEEWKENYHPNELLYTRPMERGYLTNLDCEIEVWAHMLESVGGKGLVTGVIVTAPPFAPREVVEILLGMIKSHFKIPKVVLKQPADLCGTWVKSVLHRPVCLVVDCGFSFSLVSPLVDGKTFEKAVRRIDVGGKLLTNYMKELVSYGQVNVMDETFVVEQLKRDVCYVSLDLQGDLQALTTLKNQSVLPRAQRLPMAERKQLEARFTKRYVLPDFQRVCKGFVLDPDVPFEEVAHLERQIISLTGECFLVPEVLFCPSLIGIQQAGLAQVIESVVDNCPEELRRLLRENVMITGGSTLFPNFCERLSSELGPAFRVEHVADPIGCACSGGDVEEQEDL